MEGKIGKLVYNLYSLTEEEKEIIIDRDEGNTAMVSPIMDGLKKHGDDIADNGRNKEIRRWYRQ